jgi:hypothetical protein
VDEVMRVVGVGATKVRELWALVERRLKEDAEGRVIEVR